jgi:transporter family protein
MPIAFTSPLFGALMGIFFASEPPTTKKIVGMGLTVGGIAVLSI